MPNKTNNNKAIKFTNLPVVARDPERDHADEMHVHLMNLEALITGCQRNVDKGLALIGKIGMTEKQWRGSFGGEIKFFLKLLYNMDRALNPEKYVKKGQTQPKRNPDAKVDIHGDVIAPK